MIIDWLLGFAVVAIALMAIGAAVGFVRGLLPQNERPRPNYARIEALERELLEGGPPAPTQDDLLRRELYSGESGRVIYYEGEPVVFYDHGHGVLTSRSSPPTFDG